MRLPCREQDAFQRTISVACAVSGLNNLRRLRAFPASLRTGGAGVTPPRDIGGYRREMRRPDAIPASAN